MAGSSVAEVRENRKEEIVNSEEEPRAWRKKAAGKLKGQRIKVKGKTEDSKKLNR